jgi:hypothetical protein
MTRKELMHPGFPRIGAIEVFRKNSALQMKFGEAALNEAIQKMPQYRQIKTSGKSALRGRTPHEDRDSPFILNTLIDKNAWRAGVEHIEAELEKEMKGFMIVAMTKAREHSRIKVHEMTRAFKSKKRPSMAATGDLYDVIADSLDFEEVAAAAAGSVGRNQFISFIGASREDGRTGTLYETGVRGSRMFRGGADPSLIELTEDGFPAFPMNLKIQAYYAAIRRNPAKRFGG